MQVWHFLVLGELLQVEPEITTQDLWLKSRSLVAEPKYSSKI